MKQLPERFLLFLLAAVQFTLIMDFMIMMPLGPQLMRELDIGPGWFSGLVSSYTIASGVVGLLVAPFIDGFDRRTLLLVAYAGFGVGTLACGLSQSAATLLTSRAVCGMFAGVSGSLVMAIVSDVVPAERRAAGMGIIMTAFSIAAAAGVPFGLQLAHRFSWETPFFLLAGIALVIWALAFAGLPSIRGHLRSTLSSVGEEGRGEETIRGFPLMAGRQMQAFLELLRDANAGRALLFMATLVFGHFTIIPFLAPYLVGNVGLPESRLFLVYFVGGVLTVFSAPLIGRLADSLGRLKVYCGVILVACCIVLALTNVGPLPLWAVLALSGAFFIFASGRFVPGQAIMSLAVPSPRRGAFMSLVSCTRDLAAGITSSFAGWIIVKSPSGQLLHFNWLGWIAIAVSLLSIVLASRVRVNEGVSEPQPTIASGSIPIAPVPELDLPARG